MNHLKILSLGAAILAALLTFPLNMAIGSYGIPNGSIKQAMLASRATGTTVSAGGVAISASSGNFSTIATSPAAVTNLSVTITTTGRPVFVGLISDSSSATQFCVAYASGTPSFGTVSSVISIERGGSPVFTYQVQSLITAGVTTNSNTVPCTVISAIDPVAAGTYTYTVNENAFTSSQTAGLAWAKLVAYEL